MKNEIYLAAITGNVEFLREARAIDVETDVAVYNGDELLSLTSYGNNIIHVAAQNGHLDFIIEALSFLTAADGMKLISGINSHGDTPLHYAAKQPTLKMADHLICYYIRNCSGDGNGHYDDDNDNNGNGDGEATEVRGNDDGEDGISELIVSLWWVGNEDGNTPLHLALMNGGNSLQVANFLLEIGPEVAAYTNDRNETPLHIAVDYDNQDGKKSIVNMINTLNGEGASLTCIERIFEKDSLYVIERLLEKDSTICCLQDSDGMTPLLRAAINCYLPAVETIIKSCPQSVEICDFKGRNVLHHIKLPVCLEARKFLKIPGISGLIDQQDDDGNTPVHIAAKNCSYGMVKAMMERHANFKIKNNEGVSAASIIQSNSELYNAVVKKYDEWPTHEELMSKELHVAATTGGWESLAQRLEEPNSNEYFLSRLPDGSNIIHIAVEVFLPDFTPNFQRYILEEPFWNEVFIVKALNKYPLLSCQTNRRGQTPLHLALVRRMLKPDKMLFNFIKQHLRNIKQLEILLPPWKAKDVDGNTLLHLALKYCRFEFAEYLIELDADLVIELNNSKETPLHMLCNAVGYLKKSALADTSNISHMVDLLLKDDVSAVYFRDIEGFTPLMRAVNSDLLGIAMRILHHCPQSAKHYDFEGRNILHWLKLQHRRENGRIKELYNFVPHIEILMRSADDKEETPLHAAIKNNEYGTVKFLIERLDEFKGWWNILDYHMKAIPSLLAAKQGIPRWFQELLTSKMYELPLSIVTENGRSLYQGIHKKDFKELMGPLGLVAALFATITFTAAFTVPGGTDDKSGTPILSKRVMFQAFMFADVLGMCCSILALFCLIWFLVTSHDYSSEDLILADMTISLLQVSFYATLVAFMTGVYVTTISYAPWLAIFTCVLCSLFLLLLRKSLIVAFLSKAYFITNFLTGMCTRAMTRFLKRIACYCLHCD